MLLMVLRRVSAGCESNVHGATLLTKHVTIPGSIADRFHSGGRESGSNGGALRRACACHLRKMSVWSLVVARSGSMGGRLLTVAIRLLGDFRAGRGTAPAFYISSVQPLVLQSPTHIPCRASRGSQAQVHGAYQACTCPISWTMTSLYYELYVYVTFSYRSRLTFRTFLALGALSLVFSPVPIPTLALAFPPPLVFRTLVDFFALALHFELVEFVSCGV